MNYEQTTMNENMDKFGVSSAKEKKLNEIMVRLKIYERDFKESFIRSRGSGGQNVNKVATCVYLKHIPTGLEVKCSKHRSQALNRYSARKLLAEKIEEKVLGKKSEKRKKIEKIRRQKRKRSKRAKEKMLEEKKKQSDKKVLRKKVPSNGE